MILPAYEIGTTLAGMVSLSSLGMLPPKATPVQASEQLDLGNGGARSAGLECEWRFPYLTQTQLTALRAYCSGVSASVYIRTLEAGGTYGAYSAVMVMPLVPQFLAGMLIDFTITFRRMAAA